MISSQFDKTMFQGESRSYIRSTYEQSDEELKIKPTEDGGGEGFIPNEYYLRIQYRASIKEEVRPYFQRRNWSNYDLPQDITARARIITIS